MTASRRLLSRGQVRGRSLDEVAVLSGPPALRARGRSALRVVLASERVTSCGHGDARFICTAHPRGGVKCRACLVVHLGHPRNGHGPAGGCVLCGGSLAGGRAWWRHRLLFDVVDLVELDVCRGCATQPVCTMVSKRVPAPGVEGLAAGGVEPVRAVDAGTSESNERARSGARP